MLPARNGSRGADADAEAAGAGAGAPCTMRQGGGAHDAALARHGEHAPGWGTGTMTI